jgi:hypothetical protein
LQLTWKLLRPATILGLAALVAVAPLAAGAVSDGNVHPARLGSQASLTSAGILAFNCTGGEEDVILINTKTGRTMATKNITLHTDDARVLNDSNNDFDCSLTGTPQSLRDRYNKAFTLEAVLADFPDGSVHAGYVTLTTGRFTDVSRSLHVSSFSSSSTADSNVQFDPTTGALWFADGDNDAMYKSVSPYRKLVSEPTAADGVVSPLTHVPTYGVVSPNRTLTAFVNGTPSSNGEGSLLLSLPAGTAQFTQYLYPGGPVQQGPGSSLAPVYDASTDVPNNNGITSIECLDPAFIGNTHLLCDDGPSNTYDELDLGQLALAKISSGSNSGYVYNYPTSATVDVLVASDRANGAAVVQPSGGEFAFISTSYSSDGLYVSPLQANANPKKILRLPAADNLEMALLSWQA